jgi:lysophospholipase L1-like esterase
MKRTNSWLMTRIAGPIGFALSLGVQAGPVPVSPTAPPALTRPIALPTVPQAIPVAQPVTTQPVVAPGAVQPAGTAFGRPLPGPPEMWVFAHPVATVTGPTSVELRWQLREGATGYRVWRNNVPIADLKAETTAQAFVDAKLAPGFSNTYKVWAMQAGRRATEDPLGVLLEESGPAYASTPAPSLALPHVAPTKITATGVASGSSHAVQLSWIAAAGADGYFVSRDGNTVSGLVKGTSFTDGGVPDGSHFYFVRSVYPTQSGITQSSTFDMSAATLSNPVHIRFGALNVVALGDSVMWGQGLADFPGMPPHKFTSSVRDWLMGAMGRPVMLNSFAHSGATVTPGNAAQELRILKGEVPSSFPSVGQQAMINAPGELARLGINLNDVDLVLVDGCTNDVGITTILSPGVSDTTIANATTQACSSVAKLLLDIHAKYPYAAIVLTGYFPIVGQSSDIHQVGALAVSVGAIVGPAATMLVGAPLDPATAIVGLGITYEVLRQQLIGHSNTYIATSNAALTMAAATVNSQLRGGWVTFVSPPFKDFNTYSAPASWLWNVPSGVTGRDEAYAQRLQDCSAAMLPTTGEQAKCVIASIGHPNVMGARVYADSIIAALPKFLPQWMQTFSVVQTAP